jgi:hypothetical protein
MQQCSLSSGKPSNEHWNPIEKSCPRPRQRVEFHTPQGRHPDSQGHSCKSSDKDNYITEVKWREQHEEKKDRFLCRYKSQFILQNHPI